MNSKNRAMSVLLAAAMAAGMASCGSQTSWVAKSGEDTMPAGVYIVGQIDSYYDVLDQYREANPDAETESDAVKQAMALMKADVDGKTGAQAISDLAMTRARRYFATDRLCRDRGVTLGETDSASVRQSTENMWSVTGEFYEQNGVSKDSLEKTTASYVKQNRLMENLYGAGGEREISEAEYESYFKETRSRVRYIPFALNDPETGAALSEEEVKKVEEEANSYLERVKAGEDMAALLLEHEKSVSGEELDDTTPGAYDLMLTKDSVTPSQAFVDEMLTAPEGEPRLIKESSRIFVAMRVDTMFDRAAFDYAKPAMLEELKQDEFDAWLDEQAASLDITFNDDALKRYTPEKLNFKQ